MSGILEDKEEFDHTGKITLKIPIYLYVHVYILLLYSQRNSLEFYIVLQYTNNSRTCLSVFYWIYGNDSSCVKYFFNRQFCK